MQTQYTITVKSFADAKTRFIILHAFTITDAFKLASLRLSLTDYVANVSAVEVN